jgi:hypothetical protein
MELYVIPIPKIPRKFIYQSKRISKINREGHNISVRILTLNGLQEARLKLRRLNDGTKIRDDSGACRFINERGLVLLMPVNGVPLPSISEADDAETVANFAFTARAWAWKSTLPEQKLCACAKLINGRVTFISWNLFPSLVKVYGRDGDPQYEYEHGRLKQAELNLFRIVEQLGPISSHDLWIKTMAYFSGKRNRFTAALELLQARFTLMATGGGANGWNHQSWDLVERQAPPQIFAQLPPRDEAKRNVLQQMIQNCVAIPGKKLKTILGWPENDFNSSIKTLLETGTIREVRVEGESLPCLMLNGNGLLAETGNG